MKYHKLAKSELAKYKRIIPPSKVLLEFIEKIKALGEGEAGVFELDQSDNIRPGSVKARLVRAGKVLGVNLTVRRYGQSILFWVEPDAEPETKEQKTRGKK